MSGRIPCASLLLVAALFPNLGDAQPPPQGMQGGAPAYFYGPPDHMSGGTGPVSIPAGATIYEELPDDAGWLYEEGPLGSLLIEAFSHAYFRADYLSWSISPPGDTAVTGPVAITTQQFNSPGNNVFSPPYSTAPFQNSYRRPFVVTNPATGNTAAQGIIPTLNDISIDGNNGVRTTFGMNWNPGSFEANFWGLESNSSTYDASGWIDTSGRIVNGLPIDRVVAQFAGVGGNQNGANQIIYDISYAATLKTQAWGSEANFLLQDKNPNDNFVFRPLFGVRYLSFDEQFRQRGEYTFLDNSTSPATQIETERRIDSYARNNLYGPQIGFRAELTSKWFDLGVTPRAMLGVNTWKAGLSTQQIFSPTEGKQSIVDKETTFGPVADLEAYTRVHLAPYFSVYVSYNFMWAGMLTRPYQNIVYDASSPPNPVATFRQDVHYTDAIIQGIGIGGEFSY
jgi:hypothetical protein